MTVFEIKRGDTNPPFEKRLRNEFGEPIDLSAVADVGFNMRDENYNIIVSDDTAGSVSILDASTGVVEYDWGASDTTDVGSYKAEFVVDFGADGIRSFPADDHYDIEITEDIND